MSTETHGLDASGLAAAKRSFYDHRRDRGGTVEDAIRAYLTATPSAATPAGEVTIEQPDFLYFECPECEFSSVQPADFKGSPACPMCAGDSGHDVRMSERTARSTDKPEGKDARKDDESATPSVAPAPTGDEVAGLRWADESKALHWIDRYAAGIDEEPQMDRILACVAASPIAPAAEIPTPCSMSMKDGVIQAAFNTDEEAQQVFDVLGAGIAPAAPSAPAGDVGKMIAELRATDYLDHRGPNYEPVPIPPSELRLRAADMLATLTARNAELERERDEAKAQSDRFCDKYLVALNRAEAAESAIAEANRKLDVARVAALEEAAKIAESNDAWPQEGNDIARDIRRAALSQITNAEGGPERSRTEEG